MIGLHSFRQRLTDELRSVEEGILSLWSKTEIREFRNDPGSPFFVMAHPYYWKSLPVEHRAAQASLLGKYRRWYELFHRCHALHSSDVLDELAKTNEQIINAIELKSDWGTAATFEENRLQLASKIDLFGNLLCQHSTLEEEFILVPDTNALLKTAILLPRHYQHWCLSVRHCSDGTCRA
jgi:hypothetical protein